VNATLRLWLRCGRKLRLETEVDGRNRGKSMDVRNDASGPPA
jgi:hypothetical protein